MMKNCISGQTGNNIGLPDKKSRSRECLRENQNAGDDAILHPMIPIMMRMMMPIMMMMMMIMI